MAKSVENKVNAHVLEVLISSGETPAARSVEDKVNAHVLEVLRSSGEIPVTKFVENKSTLLQPISSKSPVSLSPENVFRGYRNGTLV